jgi:hypothetical protein
MQSVAGWQSVSYYSPAYLKMVLMLYTVHTIYVMHYDRVTVGSPHCSG